MYLYFLFNKSEALDAFKVYKTEVEKQTGAQIKIVRFDKGGEYYGRYTDKGQVKGPFAEFLESEGILVQYTMPRTPQQKWCGRKKEPDINGHEQVQDPPPLEEQHEDQPTLLEPTEEVSEPVGVRKSSIVQKSAISSDYVVYLQESDYDIELKDDPCSFLQAMSGENSTLWYDATKEELVARGFTQREGINYHETFSPVSNKDSLRIIMALVAHFDLELHQMNMKITFLNGDLEEECIYLNISGRKYIFLVLYVDDILLASSDLGLLHETKYFLIENFEMKDMGEDSDVIGIEIHRDKSQRLLGLSQRAYIERILERFWMKNCSPIAAHIIKGDKFSLN
ncbi:uncharacterized protein [Nicotiana tomentosiformis]|uniref:uncharacterized protein n=1 Tax=Nicotiana tomentosiformis TaxID=4098 RepID=UPI00388CB2C1